MSKGKKNVKRISLLAILLAILIGLPSLAKFTTELVVSLKLKSFTMEVYEAVSAYETSEGFNTDLPGYQEAYDEAYEKSLVKREELKEKLPQNIKDFAEAKTEIKIAIMLFDFLKIILYVLSVITFSHWGNNYSKKCIFKERHTKRNLTPDEFLKEFDISV